MGEDVQFEDHVEIGVSEQVYDRESRLEDRAAALFPGRVEAKPMVDETGATGGFGDTEDAEPPVEVGMMVRTERGGKEVPFLVMEIRDDDVVDGLMFSMIGPAHVRPVAGLMRTPPGNGGWWFDWEGRT